MHAFLLALVLICGVTGSSLAEEQASPSDSPVAVHARAEPDTVTIGTHFRYVVEVTVHGDVEVLLSQPSEKVGDFEIVDFGTEAPTKRDDVTVIRRWYELVGYSPGEYLVESPPVQYRLGGEELQQAPGDEIRVSVESVLKRAEDTSDIRDIKEPERPPVDWRPYYLLAAAGLAVLAVGLVSYRVLGRPRRPRPPPPPRPAHEIAAAELVRLRARRLIEQGAFKEYYSELSGIVRRYLERRFELRAPEMTTEEFLLASARDGRLAGGHRRLVGEFLTESDLVKFARHTPTTGDGERAHAAARRLIEETAALSGPAAENSRATG